MKVGESTGHEGPCRGERWPFGCLWRTVLPHLDATGSWGGFLQSIKSKAKNGRRKIRNDFQAK